MLTPPQSFVQTLPALSRMAFRANDSELHISVRHNLLIPDV